TSRAAVALARAEANALADALSRFSATPPVQSLASLCATLESSQPVASRSSDHATKFVERHPGDIVLEIPSLARRVVALAPVASASRRAVDEAIDALLAAPHASQSIDEAIEMVAVRLPPVTISTCLSQFAKDPVIHDRLRGYLRALVGAMSGAAGSL